MTIDTHTTRLRMRIVCVMVSVILVCISMASMQTAYAAYDTRASELSRGQVGEADRIVSPGICRIEGYFPRISASHGKVLPIIVKKRGNAVRAFSRGDHETLRMIVGWLFMPVFFGFEHPMGFCFVLFCCSVLFIIVEEYRSERKDCGASLTPEWQS